MDGTSVNLNAMKLFWCKSGDSLEKIDGTFFHNSFDCIYFIADPPHMLKLARNALGEMKVFIDDQGRKIEWKFIQLLHDEQMKLGPKFTNSISNRHIVYHRNKMNVKIASQTLNKHPKYISLSRNGLTLANMTVLTGKTPKVAK